MLSRKGEVGGGTMEDSAAELINKNNNYYHWLSDPGRRALPSHLLFPFTCQQQWLKSLSHCSGPNSTCWEDRKTAVKKKEGEKNNRKKKVGGGGWKPVISSLTCMSVQLQEDISRLRFRGEASSVPCSPASLPCSRRLPQGLAARLSTSRSQKPPRMPGNRAWSVHAVCAWEQLQ